MKLALSPEVEKSIRDRVASGEYRSLEDVVAAAVAALDQEKERAGEFAPGELEQLLAEGEQSGEPLDGATVLAEIRALGKGGRGE